VSSLSERTASYAARMSGESAPLMLCGVWPGGGSAERDRGENVRNHWRGRIAIGKLGFLIGFSQDLDVDSENSMFKG
jgi:hypothetical protein